MSEEVKLREAAKLIHLSGKISPMHEKNMKLYPYVFFEKVTQVKIDYDLSNRLADDKPEEQKKKTADDYYKDIGKAAKRVSNAYVSYDLILDEEANKEHLDKRISALEQSIRTLFWNNVIVEISFNGKIMFKSKKVES